MTVCLAALCKDGDDPLVVVAADRMVTLGGFIEFEHAVPKMAPAASGFAIAMVAGDTLTGTRLAREVSDQLTGTPTVMEIAQRLAAQYDTTRRQRIEEQVLAARGLDFSTFYAGHASFNPQITVMIDQQITQFNLGVELLLGGFDSSGAHIYSVHNPGRPEMLHDVIGYAAIGSGAIHSLQAFIGFGHSSTAEFHQTVFRAYAAKRRAEVAPGVGLDTDMALVSAAGIQWVTAEQLDQLRDIYEDFERTTGDELKKRLANFSLGQNDEQESSGANADK